MKIGRQTYYDWFNTNVEFQNDIINAKEAIIDELEQAALTKAVKGDTTLLIFLLKTLGKKRGYIEGSNKVDITVKQEPQTFTIKGTKIDF